MLKQRVISAVVILPLFIALLWLPNQWFALTLALLVLIAGWEWGRLVALAYQFDSAKHFSLIYVLVAAGMLWLSTTLPLMPLLAVAVLWWIVAGVLVIGYPATAKILRQHWWMAAIMGMLVLVPAWQALISLQGRDFGPWWVLFFMVLIWVADIAAYFVGKRWGSTKLAPNLSPGKSWQGVWGGMIASTAVCMTGAALLGYTAGFLLWFLFIGIVTVVSSIVGDLLESLLKREAGVKDSGKLIPGHGGLLDRIDSVLAASPVFFVFLSMTKTGI